MKVTAAESEILKVLWRSTDPIAADDVIAKVDPDQGWSDGTIRTFLARLVKKKVVAVEKDGRRYLYRPLVTQEEYAHQESRSLIERLFGGSIAPFVTQFSERQALSDKEIAELKKLIRRLERER